MSADIEECQRVLNDWMIRPAIGKDLAFIYDTWLKSYKSDSYIGKSVKGSIFFDSYRFVIDHILSRSDTIVYIACLPKDQNTIVSYMVTRPNTIDYCFTKEAFRHLGIAGSIFDTAFKNCTNVICTHKTFYTKNIFLNNPGLEFNPFILFQTHREQ